MPDNNRNPFEEEFKNSYTYKVAKQVEPAAREIAKAAGKVVTNVAREGGKIASDAVNEFNKSYQQNRANQPRPKTGPAPYGYNPKTGTPNPPPYGSAPNYSQNSYNYVNQKYTAPQPASVNKYAAKQAYKEAKRKAKAEKDAKGSLRFYLAGILLMLYAWGFPFYSMTHFFIAIAVCVGGYHLGKYLTKMLKKKSVDKAQKEYEEAKAKEQKMAEEAIKAAEEEAKAKKRAETTIKRTGNKEIDEIIDEGNKYIIELREANEKIPGEEISISIDRIEKACRGIFEYVAEHPEKKSEISKFMNYYLPTTLKLLKSYQNLDKQVIKGDTISSTMFDIEGMMVTIASAFEKKLDNLFESDQMDISADIAVFENILSSEGLTDDGENIVLTK